MKKEKGKVVGGGFRFVGRPRVCCGSARSGLYRSPSSALFESSSRTYEASLTKSPSMDDESAGDNREKLNDVVRM